MDLSPIHERLVAAAGTRTYKHLGEMTGTHPETVRRYMSGQSPSAEYLTAFCRQLGVSATWLLTGQGPMRLEELRSHALREADPSDLLGAMADAVERLLDRVDRIEAYIQTLETLVRGLGSVAASAKESNHDHAAAGVVVTVDRARRIARAVPERAPPDAG